MNFINVQSIEDLVKKAQNIEPLDKDAIVTRIHSLTETVRDLEEFISDEPTFLTLVKDIQNQINSLMSRYSLEVKRQ